MALHLRFALKGNLFIEEHQLLFRLKYNRESQSLAQCE